MRTIKDFFQTPHPAHTDPWIYLRTITIISLVIFFILYAIRPFDWSRVSDDRMLIMASISSAATFSAMLLFYLWRYLFPAFFSEPNWTLGKEIALVIYQFTVVSFAVWLVRNYVGQQWTIPHRSYLFTWWIVCTTGIIPYLLATSVKQIYHIRRYIAEAVALNSNIRGDIPKEYSVFRLPRNLGTISDFLFAESRDNYVEIYWLENGEVQRQLFRCTLLELEECNAGTPLFRCHRAFIINLYKISHVTGNAAGFQVTVHHQVPPVPVSRSYTTAFKTRLADSAFQLT